MRTLIQRFERQPAWWLIVLAGLVAVLVVTTRALPAPASPAATPHGTADGAWDVCRQFVTARLKAPATATFPHQSAATITPEAGERFLVVAYVDSQNSFGALLRSRFACEVDWRGGTDWDLVGIRIE